MQSSWQPSASLQNLQQRAQILRQIREFFFARNVLEVETPVLCHTSVPDPQIQSIPAFFQSYTTGSPPVPCYLQTSPEYAMKRLLAAGSGSIYQITKAFRQGETGRFHNPEFSMLEWYRCGFDHRQLMDEMDDLLQLILKTGKATRYTYTDVFEKYLQLNPHQAEVSALKICAQQHHIDVASDVTDKDSWLQILMSHYIEPQLGKTAPAFIYDFPASQASLAKIIPGNPPVAARFEVYCRGVELANGFYELQNAAEQRARFQNNLQERKKAGLEPLPIDEFLLAALTHGLPDCAGVALGIDRLIMLALQSESIAEVLSFGFERA